MPHKAGGESCQGKDTEGVAKKVTCSKFPSLGSESIGENEFLRNIFDASTKGQRDVSRSRPFGASPEIRLDIPNID